MGRDVVFTQGIIKYVIRRVGLLSVKRVDRNEMESGFEREMLKHRPTSFNRKEKIENVKTPTHPNKPQGIIKNIQKM